MLLDSERTLLLLLIAFHLMQQPLHPAQQTDKAMVQRKLRPRHPLALKTRLVLAPGTD